MSSDEPIYLKKNANSCWMRSNVILETHRPANKFRELKCPVGVGGIRAVSESQKQSRMRRILSGTEYRQLLLEEKEG